MLDNICSQEFPDFDFRCSPDGFFENGILEIKCNTPVTQLQKSTYGSVIAGGGAKAGKSMRQVNFSFSLVTKEAKKLKRALSLLGKKPTPYKHYGVAYKNLSLKKKLVAKFILKVTYKH